MNILKKCIITIITISLIFVFFKYKNKDITENSIDSVLKDAHENRSELEFVLTYFKDDSIKYNAAKFLIQNMSRHFSITSPELDEIKEIKYNKWHLNDSDKTKYANFNYNKLPKSYDLKEIKASLLINNINLAVDVWMSRPWHNKYSFDEFCEYVLPYRVGDEPLEDWRALYYNRYACILDSLYKGKDPVEAAEKIMTYIKQEGFDNYTDIKLPHLGASFLYKQRAGYCRENCDIALYVLRSLGIPVAMDFYESSPSYNSRHFWTAIIDTCHPRKSIAFNYTEDPINRDRATGSRRKGKVYRHYYSNQTKLADYTFTNNVPSFFKRQDIADVTHEYFGHNSILINNHCIFKNPFI